MTTRYDAVEVDAHQAWFLADHLRVGAYPWMLAITAPMSIQGSGNHSTSAALRSWLRPASLTQTGTSNPLSRSRLRPYVSRASGWNGAP